MMTFDTEGGQFVLMQFDKELSKARCIQEKRGEVLTSFFISKDRIC